MKAQSGPGSRPNSRGFTLLEVIVMLMVVSLVSVVLMQGMSLVLRLRTNLSAQTVDLDQIALKRNYVRQPLQGLIGDFPDGKDKFRGEPKSVSGLTTQPLFRRAGRAITFVLALEFNASDSENTLSYRESEDQPVIIAQWEGDEAFFKYIGTMGQWDEVWPPPEGPVLANVITDVKAPQLPEFIFLDTGSATEIDYGIAIPGKRNRLPRDPLF
jgi:general secretion pathway protein J